jgi:hypothetical protein
MKAVPPAGRQILCLALKMVALLYVLTDWMVAAVMLEALSAVALYRKAAGQQGNC